MPTEIDAKPILKEHVGSLRSLSTGRHSVIDHALLFGIPFALLGLSLYAQYDLNGEARSALINASAIFLGLLLNLLILMFDQQNKNSDRLRAASAENPADDHRISRLQSFRSLIEQTISNIAFTTLLSILALSLLILHSVLVTRTGNFAPHITPVISAAALGLWACILATSTMILKRVFNLLMNAGRN